MTTADITASSPSRRLNLVPKRVTNAVGQYETIMVRADSNMADPSIAKRAPLEQPRPVVTQRDMSISEFVTRVNNLDLTYSMVMDDGTEAVLVHDAVLSAHSPDPVFHIDHIDLESGQVYNPVIVTLPAGSTGAEIDALIITTVSKAIANQALDLADRLGNIVERTPTIRESLLVNGMSPIEVGAIRYDRSRARDARLILQTNSDVMSPKDRSQLISAGIID